MSNNVVKKLKVVVRKQYKNKKDFFSRKLKLISEYGVEKYLSAEVRLFYESCLKDFDLNTKDAQMGTTAFVYGLFVGVESSVMGIKDEDYDFLRVAIRDILGEDFEKGEKEKVALRLDLSNDR